MRRRIVVKLGQPKFPAILREKGALGVNRGSNHDAVGAQDPLNFHPLRNDRTTAISAKALLKFVRATGHEPLISPMSEIVRTP